MLSGEPRPSCGGPLRILGSRVDPVTSRNALKQIQDFLVSGQPHHVITGNTLMLLAAEEDLELRRILDSAALVVPESSGILWASRALGWPLEEFTPGIDLMMAICRMAAEKGHPAFLLGSAPGVAEEAAKELQRKFPALVVAGTYHGFFTSPHPASGRLLPTGEGSMVSLSRRERAGVRQNLSEAEVIELVRQTKPSILFVGVGMPAQEKWIARNLQALGVPVVIGVGGSFDVLSGKLVRAPAWMRRMGVEWLYRLVQEPWRWRRIAQLPVFAWRVLREKQHGKSQM